MWLSGIWFTGEREQNISGVFALAVSDWAEEQKIWFDLKYDASMFELPFVCDKQIMDTFTIFL